MRLILISAVAAILLFAVPTAYAVDSWFGTHPIQAKDEEKKSDQEKSEENATGDEEPECE